MAQLNRVNLLTDLRRMTDTAVGAYTVNSVSYWTDDQLEEIMQGFAVDYDTVPLMSIPQYYNGTWEHRKYRIPKSLPVWLEYFTPAQLTANQALAAEDQLDEDVSFYVVDVEGVVVDSSTYTYHKGRRTIEFAADTNVTQYYLRVIGYNLNEIAAQVWYDKAAHRVELVDWRGGDHQVKEDQEWKHCMEMAQHYSRYSGMRVTTLIKVGYT